MDSNTLEMHRLSADTSSTATQLQAVVSLVPDMDAVAQGERLTALGKAVEAGHAIAVLVLLQAGASVQTPPGVALLADEEADASTFLDPLGQAVQLFLYEMSNDPQSDSTQHRFEVVTHLLGAGADPVAIDPVSAHSPLSELMTQLEDYAGSNPSVEDMEPALRLLALLVHHGVDMEAPSDAAAIEQTPGQRLEQMADVSQVWQSYLRQAQLEKTLPEPPSSAPRMRM